MSGLSVNNFQGTNNIPFSSALTNNMQASGVRDLSKNNNKNNVIKNTVIVAGSVLATALAAYCLLKKGKITKTPDVIEKTARKASNRVLTTKDKELAANIAKKFKIKSYTHYDELKTLEDVYYKDGKPYSGKAIDVLQYTIDKEKEFKVNIYKYNNGKSISQHTIYKGFKDNISDVRGGVSTWSIDKNGKINISMPKGLWALQSGWNNEVTDAIAYAKAMKRWGNKEKASNACTKALHNMLKQFVGIAEKTDKSAWAKFSLRDFWVQINGDLPGLQKIAPDNKLIADTIKFCKSSVGKSINEVLPELKTMTGNIAKELKKSAV